MVLRYRFQELSTYGIMKDCPAGQLREMIAFLVSEGYLKAEAGQYPTLSLGPKAVPVLRGQEKVTIRRTLAMEPEKKQDVAGDEALFQRLRERRKELAAAAKVPPYIILSDASLRAMAARCPTTLEEMLSIPGVGKYKLDKYGEIFLKIISEYRREQGMDAQSAEQPEKKPSESLPRKRTSERLTDEQGRKIASADATYVLFQLGKSVDEIASLRGLARSTVEGHLLRSYEKGLPVDGAVFASPQEQALIWDAYQGWTGSLREFRESLPEDVSYAAIQYTLLEHHVNPWEHGAKAAQKEENNQ